jgi:hypothetical protein
MKPVGAITTDWTIGKSADEIAKKLCDFANSLWDRDLKQQVEEILEEVQKLKQSAFELEDENRDLQDIVTNMYCDLACLGEAAEGEAEEGSSGSSRTY